VDAGRRRNGLYQARGKGRSKLPPPTSEDRLVLARHLEQRCAGPAGETLPPSQFDPMIRRILEPGSREPSTLDFPNDAQTRSLMETNSGARMLTPFQHRAHRALAASPLFEGCASRVRRAAVRRGQILFEKGEPSDALYGVVSGQLKLYAEGADGRQVSFGLYGPGEILGAIGIATGAPRHASVVALAHSELAMLQQRDLEPLFDRQPGLRETLARVSAEQARLLSERIADAAFLRIEDRVEKALRDFAERFGERVEGGICVRLRQQDLADVLGLSRESISKVLTSRAMRERVRLGRGRIVLKSG
jgi:CRP-like cAMP-binding protein